MRWARSVDKGFFCLGKTDVLSGRLERQWGKGKLKGKKKGIHRTKGQRKKARITYYPGTLNTLSSSNR